MPHSFWHTVNWNDETKIELYGHNHIWRGINKAYSEQNTIPTVKHGDGSLMFWEGVSSKGMGNHGKMYGKMNAACYQKILADHLHSSARKLCMGCSWTFQHDNDTKHKGKLTPQWLQQKKLKVLAWPSQTPDVHFIEPLWGDLKHAVHARRPKTLHDLEAFCQDEWAAIPPAIIWGLIDNYYKRLHAVIDAKRSNTPY
uniref:Tc1-like transposase DDE domain-containing protein n=1 Tax=Esox lucius TaxID=8010 RepID=A0AAY5KY04_ESOLU